MPIDPLAGYPAWMTVSQVAEVTQMNPKTLYLWRETGSGPPWTRLGEGRGSSIRYPREGLRKYLDDRTRPAAPKVSAS